MASNTFPDDWRDQPCAIAFVPVPLVPFVSGLTKILENRGFWASEADYIAGSTATIEFRECIAMACVQDITDRQDALYRLINTAFYGVTYDTVTTDPLVVTPPITPHVTLDIHDYASIQGRLEDLQQMLNNALTGAETPHFSNEPSIRFQLQEIIDAIGSGTDLTEVLADLEAIAVLLA